MDRNTLPSKYVPSQYVHQDMKKSRSSTSTTRTSSSQPCNTRSCNIPGPYYNSAERARNLRRPKNIDPNQHYHGKSGSTGMSPSGQAFWKTSGSIQSSDIENKSMQVPKSKKVKSKSSSESIGSKHTHISSIEDPFPRGSSQSFYTKDLKTKALLASKSIMTDMFVAASVGDAPLLDFYLRVGSLSVDAADARGWRAIHHGSLHGQTKVVELLVRRGANVNCGTISGLTPLLLAGSSLTPRYDVMAILLKQDANPNVCSPAGTSPLMDICGRQYDMETQGLCILLLHYGAESGKQDNKGRNAVDYACTAGNNGCIQIINDFKNKSLKK